MPSAIARSTSSTRRVDRGREHELRPPEAAARAHVPVGRADRRVGGSERRTRRVRVHRELQQAAAGGGSSSGTPIGSAGLVVDDPERPAVGHVDAVGGAPEAQRAPVGEREVDRGRAVGEAEAQLGGDGAQTRSGSHVVVLGEEAVELGEDAPPVAVPEQPAAGAALCLVHRHARLGDLAQPLAVGVAPRGVGGGRALGPGEDLGEEAVERLVHQAPAVERRDLVALLGQLGDLDPQHVLEQVVVGAVGVGSGAASATPPRCRR